MSKEFQIRDGNLIASFDLENEDGDIDFCKLLKVSHGVADEIGMFVDYVATNKIIKDQTKKIADLEAKFAEKEVKYNKLKQCFDKANEHCTFDELRKIILEGEESSDKKVIEMLNNEVAYLQKQCEINQDVIDLMQQNKYQDKISFAVEQLEKVKETTECVLDNALKNSSLNQSYYDRLLDEIDNQIKAIKGKK